MRILILGGGGFIGSALLKTLAVRFSCVCFGHNSRFDQLRQILPADVEFVRGDITDGRLLSRIIPDIDVVINVAGSAGEADCLAHPVQSVLTHVSGTHQILRELSRHRGKRLIFTSTIAVYGTYRERSMPLTENTDLRPDDFYGALKATAEREVIDGDRFQVFRLANVYGVGSGIFSLSSGVIGNFVDAIRRRVPLLVYGDGRQLIDYVHIDDVCRAYEMAIQKPDGNFIYNLGGGNPVPIRELAELARCTAKTELGWEPEVRYVEAPANKIWPDRWLSNSKIEMETEWRAQISLATGIQSMLRTWVPKTKQTAL